ncbi:MAG: flavodoxin family protein [Promethearchaeota archaeon]
MKIAVLNGSPKGENSCTMQYIFYIQKKFPQHELKILNVAQQIKRLEKSEEKFQSIIEEIKASEGVIWAFPLYVMLVSYQYKRFIELINEREVGDAFKNKHAALLCTSIHFYDHTAINYINAICNDLKMRFVGYHSANMYDLMEEKQRNNLISFAEDFFSSIEANSLTTIRFPPLKFREFEYIPSEVNKDKEKIDVNGKKILVLTDSTDENTNLGKMIQSFRNYFSSDIETINIYDIDIKGGCLGCCQCAYDNQCVYRDKDGFTEFFNTKLRTPDILIYAGTIKDRYLSSRWKLILDRSFFNGHTPTAVGRQVGYIISGPVGQLPNIQQIFMAMAEISDSNLVDIITDEDGDSKQINSRLYNFAKRLVKFSNANYIRPGTFLAEGGRKLFRDAIYKMRFLFQADHKYYEEHGWYDFPQEDKQAKQMNDMLIPLITKNEKFRKNFYARATTEMIKPLQAIVKNPKK